MIEIRRTRGYVAQRVAGEWNTVKEIMTTRELSDEYVRLFQDLVRKHAPKMPLKIATVRQEYEKCIEVEMRAVIKKHGREAFEKAGADYREIRIQLGLDYVAIGQLIRSTRDLSSGQWISTSKEGSQQWYRLRVDSVDEAYLYASRHEKEEIPDFREGDKLRCRLWRDEDARYLFSTRVIVFDDPPPGWRLAHVNDMKRVQARAHFRIRHDQSTIVGVINAPIDGNLDNVSERRVVTKLRGRITSLSAGGCALVLPQTVSKRVLLRIGLNLPGKISLELEASVVSVSAISGGRYLARTRFVGLDDANRDAVAKYVLSRQQILIKEKEAP